MNSIIRGKAYVCPDFTDSYKILPSKYWMGGESASKLDPNELGPHALEGLDTEFARAASDGKFTIIVAGRMFGGGGKSIEQPIVALKAAGVKAVLAETMARYFYRNVINNGVPGLNCPGITLVTKTGDELEVDFQSGKVRNLTNGKAIQALPLPQIALDIISAGGAVAYTREKLRQTPSFMLR
jgi:3-isopropylmalate/(R)-2-methylmalate dehydratase small subunit